MQSILSERQLDMSQCHSIHLFDSSMVRGGESLNAECTYLDCWKLFFFSHYSMLYCPVLIVKGVVLDRHCVCSCAWLQEMLKKKRKRAQAQSFSTLLSTSCGFKSIVALTQSKHRKCQHLFTESFVQRRKKTKYFLFVKQNTRMCRARDDQKMTSTYHHSLSRHYKAPPPPPAHFLHNARQCQNTTHAVRLYM